MKVDIKMLAVVIEKAGIQKQQEPAPRKASGRLFDNPGWVYDFSPS